MPDPANLSSEALFRDPSLWCAPAGDPHMEERAGIVRTLLPVEAKTVIDVGCGNGILERRLAPETLAIGLDPAVEALRAFDLPRVCGRGEALPFRSSSADAVLCLEVLEHLQDVAAAQTAREIARVTRRWILVATPDREDPKKNSLRCPRCELVFNRSHHLRSYDAAALARLFPEFEVRTVRRGGQGVRPYPRPLLWLRHNVARRYYKGPGETHGLCPGCGNRAFPRHTPTLLSVALDGLNRLISPRRPYWVFVFLERRS